MRDEVRARSGVEEDRFFFRNDPCHLTVLGCSVEAQALADLLRENHLAE